MAVIETEGLTKRYGETVAVADLDLRVREGEIFGFLGPNGSGKTTTIGMLMGILTPTAGTFRLFGHGDRAGLLEARQRTGATLEQPNFYPYLSGRDNLRLVARVKGVDAGAVDRSLERVGLSARAGDKFKGYSLGMKQRLALAGTLLGDPDLLVLDEPTNGLDPEGMREIRRVIRRLGEEGTTIFLSSHLLWEVERVCTRVAILREGRVAVRSPVEELTAGTARVGVSADDLEALEEALEARAGVRVEGREGRVLVVELEDGDPADLNRHLSERGIHVSRLEPRRRTLEDAFLEATGASGEPGMEEVA